MPQRTTAITRLQHKSILTESPTRRLLNKRRSSLVLPERQTGSTYDDGARIGAIGCHVKISQSPRRSIFDTDNISIGQTWPAVPSSSGRSFSDVYGHSHQLELPSELIQPKTGTKRRASDASEALSPKRVHFSHSESHQDQTSRQTLSQADVMTSVERVAPHRYDIAREDLAVDSDFIDRPGLHLLTALRDVTEPLSISQISILLRILQKLTGDFAAQWFADMKEDTMLSVTMNSKTFPLQDLKFEHPALYLTTVNVLDASTSAENVFDFSLQDNVERWMKFFADPNYRPYLVSAILGEWFTQRIFKDPAFGLSDEGRKEIEDIDKAYIHSDSFVRVKKRSEAVARHRSMRDADKWLIQAADKFVDELMLLLAPVFGYAHPSDPHNERISVEDSDQEAAVRAELCELIIKCATVNLAIVRTGENGTVIRPAPRLDKGKQFFPTAPMECVNPTMCEYTRPSTIRGEAEVLAVKMTCWPRMEAWVPHGRDQEELAAIEREEKATQYLARINASLGDHDQTASQVFTQHNGRFCWECSEQNTLWDILPTELQHKEHERREKRRLMEISSKNLRKAQRRRSGGDDSNNPDDSNSSIDDDDQFSVEDDKKLLTGSWITEFTCLAPNMVYCEWVKPNECKINAYKTRQTISLENAIKAARSDFSRCGLLEFLSLNNEDMLFKIWEFYAAHNFAIEWSIFFIGLGVSLSRAGILEALGNTFATPIRIVGKMIDQTGEVCGLKTLAHLVIGLSDNVLCGISSSQLSDQLHSARVVISRDTLSNAHSYVNNNVGSFKTALQGIVAPFQRPLTGTTGHGKSRLFTGISSMTNFVGQQRPFTSNPIINFNPVKSVVSLAGSVLTSHTVSLLQTDLSKLSQLSKSRHHHTLGPVVAASPASRDIASLSQRVMQADGDGLSSSQDYLASVVQPYIEISNIDDDDVLSTGDSGTIVPVTSTSTVFATAEPATSTLRVTTVTPGFLYNAFSKFVNKAGDYLPGGTRKGQTRTILVHPGEQTTTIMVRRERKVV